MKKKEKTGQSNSFAANYSNEDIDDNGMYYSSPMDYYYGINGSLRYKYTYDDGTGQPHENFYLFDAYGNMNSYCDNGETYAYYSYDDAGQRTYKMDLYNTNVTTNQYGFAYLQLDRMTLYPNGFMNINQYGEYTKHYYAEDQRIASKIGRGSVLGENLCDNLDGRFNVMPHELDNLRYLTENKIQYDLTLTTIPDTWVDVDYGGINICDLQDNGAYDYEDELFFYHGNHLSSTQMITDMYSNVVQAVHYAPFGEVISEYNAYWHNGKIPDYMFNAKEFDEENGMYYYEARYYNPPMFISRDPLFEKYPYMSPYAYCLNNPLIFIDPTGKDVEIVCPETQQKYAYTPGMPVPDGASDFVSNTINSLNAMHSTKNGNTVLGELVNSSNIFSVTNEVSSTGNPAFASNANGGGTLKMGNSTNLNAISHELFHGYQHENGQGGASIFNEVEAYLFAWSVSSENSGDRGYLSSLSSMNPNTINGQSFDNSINNLQFGTMFSKQDFSNVMNLFKAEADVNKAGTYNQYPRQRANQTKSLLQRFYPLNK